MLKAELPVAAGDECLSTGVADGAVDLITSFLCFLQRFVDSAILAYECGMNEDSLRHELKVYKQSLEQQMAPPGMVGCNCSGCTLAVQHEESAAVRTYLQAFTLQSFCRRGA